MEKERYKNPVPINERRLLSRKGLAAYLSISADKAVEYGKDAGAVVRIGTRLLFDRLAIDAALNAEREGRTNGKRQ